jgi:hypothetical protein
LTRLAGRRQAIQRLRVTISAFASNIKVFRAPFTAIEMPQAENQLHVVIFSGEITP